MSVTGKSVMKSDITLLRGVQEPEDLINQFRLDDRFPKVIILPEVDTFEVGCTVGKADKYVILNSYDSAVEVIEQINARVVYMGAPRPEISWPRLFACGVEEIVLTTRSDIYMTWVEKGGRR